MKVLVIFALACAASLSTSAEELRGEIIPGPAEVEFIKLNSTNSRTGITYYIAKTKSTYIDALSYCTLTDRRLAMIKTDVQQTTIVKGLIEISHEIKGNVWLNSYCYNGAWYWGDKSPVVYNELPNGRRDCFNSDQAIMLFGLPNAQPLLYTWAGEGKSEANYFICQSP